MTILNGIDYGNFSDVQLNISIAIDAYRDKILYNKFTWNNNRWDCDTVSRQNISGACTFVLQNGNNVPPGFVWRDFDNVNHPVSASDMQGLGNALLAFTFTAYGVAWYHKSTITAITDETQILDVLNYDYTVGWPDESLSYAVTSATPGSSEFQVSTDVTSKLATSPKIMVTGSTGNNGAYTVVSCSFDNADPGTTTIVVNETIVSSTGDGNVVIS